MSRLTSHQRRRERHREAHKAAVVQANLSQPVRPSPSELIPVALGSKSARFHDPVGAVFKARTVDRPKLRDRTHYFPGLGRMAYRLDIQPLHVVRVPLDPYTGRDVPGYVGPAEYRIGLVAYCSANAGGLYPGPGSSRIQIADMTVSLVTGSFALRRATAVF